MVSVQSLSAEPRFQSNAFFVKAPDGRRVNASFRSNGPSSNSGVLRIEHSTGPTLVPDVIHPQLMPAGRAVMERFAGDTGVAFVVHRISPEGEIYDSLHSFGGYQMGTMKASFTHYVAEQDKIVWFELWDPTEGLGLPMSFTVWNRRQEISANFLGASGVFYGKGWLEAKPSRAEDFLQSILSTYRVPSRIAKPGFYAYKWKTPDGHRWAFLQNSSPTVDQVMATESQARYRHFRALQVDWPSSLATKPLYSPFFSDWKLGNFLLKYDEKASEKGDICLAQREDKRFDLLSVAPPGVEPTVEVLATLDENDEASIQAALAPLRKVARERNKALAQATPSQEDLLNEHYQKLGGYFLEYYDRKLSKNDFQTVEFDISQEGFDPKSKVWVRTYVVLRKPELISFEGLQQVKLESNYPMAVEIATNARVDRIELDAERKRKREAEVRQRELEWERQTAARQTRYSNPYSGSSQSHSNWYVPRTHPAVMELYVKAVNHAAEKERLRVQDLQWRDRPGP